MKQKGFLPNVQRHCSLLLLLILFVSFQNVSAYSKKNYLLKSTTEDDLEKALLPLEKWVPYPAYENRAEWNKIFGSHASQYASIGEKLLSYEWKLVPATAYLEYMRSGERMVMQDPLRNNVDALTSLVMAELAEGKGRFTDQIINGVYALCEMTSWTLSAHLAAAQLSKSPLPEVEDQVIALMSSDISSLLSWTYYFLHKEFDKVNPYISKRMENELERRIMSPYLNTDRFWWMAFDKENTRLVNNWNPWCNANVLETFLIMEKDPERLLKAVYRTMRSVDQFINYTHLDGGCEEGPSYWGHAAGKLYDYLSVLSMATGGNVSLFHEKMIRNMGEYICRAYVGNNWVVNFADASAHFDANPRLIFRFGKAVDSREMMAFAKEILGEKGLKSMPNEGHDMFRALESIRHQNSLEAYNEKYEPRANSWYPETEVAYMRRGDWFLAAKGGYNDESHNHNDVGTFILYYKNEPMIVDIGVGTYTRKTFSPERYTIWTMRSLYHNLPVINGQEEPYGKAYKAKQIRFRAAKGELMVDLSTAFKPEAGIQSWQRNFQLDKRGLKLHEDFRLQQVETATQYHFMVAGEVNAVGTDSYEIRYNGAKIRLLYDARHLNGTVEPIEVGDPRLTKVWGETVYRLTFTEKNKETKGKRVFRFVE